ncbi:hypothetical protein K440DRAFT_496844, partial [Wilcoxina mikolae CBS 423.85]
PPPPDSTNSLLMSLLNPTPLAAVVAVITIILTPLLLHFLIFRTRDSTTLPTFLLLGPASSGKTTLMTTFASSPSETRTSQSPLSLECDIPASLTTSQKFRSTNDPSLRGVHRFLLQDTPGHGKLRPRAIEMISGDTRGVVFVLDASTQEWSDAAEYLYGVLLRVQKLLDTPGNKRDVFPVLVACNKSDLFTALPAGRIRSVLKEELERVREGRSRGIVGVGEEEEEVDVLGGGGRFTFEALEELGVKVVFKGASTLADGWRLALGEWVGESL